MCMKSEYSILSLLIPGLRSPGNVIDLYLQPLIDDLKLLWYSGVETYDTSRNDPFQMRPTLTWITKEKFACPCCNYGTNSSYLIHSWKMI